MVISIKQHLSNMVFCTVLFLIYNKNSHRRCSTKYIFYRIPSSGCFWYKLLTQITRNFVYPDFMFLHTYTMKNVPVVH